MVSPMRIRRPATCFAIGRTATCALLPTAFLPDEDQGFLMTLVQTPVGASMTRTRKVLDLLIRR